MEDPHLHSRVMDSAEEDPVFYAGERDQYSEELTQAPVLCPSLPTLPNDSAGAGAGL